MPGGYDSYWSSFEGDEPEAYGQCFRCGRVGHFSTECYAKRHLSGRELAVAKRAKFTNEAKKRGVYTLKDSSGRMYVGKSHDVDSRIAAHGRGDGTQFVGRDFKVVDNYTEGPHNDLESWERNETLTRIYKHGIENVRGWMFVSLEPTEQQRRDVFVQVCEKFDLCRRCGRNSHFADRCFAKGKAAWAEF